MSDDTEVSSLVKDEQTSRQKWFAPHIYICIFPQNVAEPSQETQARAHVLMQDPTHAAEQSQGLADQLMTISKKPWKAK